MYDHLVMNNTNLLYW